MTDEHLVIVMEYAANGQLAERIDTSGPLPEDLARRLYRQLIDGMAYSHAQASTPTVCRLSCWLQSFAGSRLGPQAVNLSSARVHWHSAARPRAQSKRQS